MTLSAIKLIIITLHDIFYPDNVCVFIMGLDTKILIISVWLQVVNVRTTTLSYVIIDHHVGVVTCFYCYH